MKLIAMSVHDAKGAAFVNPFFVPNEGMGARDFTACANDPDHAFCRFPEDYTLYKVGEYDTETGELVPTFPPKHVISGVQALDLRPLPEGTDERIRALMRFVPKSLRDALEEEDAATLSNVTPVLSRSGRENPS
jgi:hypothetical protein